MGRWSGHTSRRGGGGGGRRRRSIRASFFAVATAATASFFAVAATTMTTAVDGSASAFLVLRRPRGWNYDDVAATTTIRSPRTMSFSALLYSLPLPEDDDREDDDDDHRPKRRRSSSSSRRRTMDVRDVVVDAAVANAQRASANAMDEAGKALAEAADALAEEEETLARKLGLNSVEELEDAIDSMEGFDADDGRAFEEELSRSEKKEEEDDDDESDREQFVPPHRRRRQQQQSGPFPAMPSALFANLARSQFELLSNSLVRVVSANNPGGGGGKPLSTTTKNKIRSIVLYLPKENDITGRLEFVPASTYPDPNSEKRGVFIAPSSSMSTSTSSSERVMRFRRDGPPPIMRLPGFFDAGDLIPGYPFVSGGTTSEEEEEEEEEEREGEAEVGEDDGGGTRRRRSPPRRRRRRGGEMFASASNDSPIGVSAVEEIPSPSSSSYSSGSVRGSPPSLSVTLFCGLDTLGVLVIWPTSCNEEGYDSDSDSDSDVGWDWTSDDKLQVSRAARSLALALSMDNELASSRLANEKFRVTLADGMHQVKSPLQALRTFGKLLQRQLAEGDSETERAPPAASRRRRAMELAEDIMSQGERVIDLIEPMDALIRRDVGDSNMYLLRGDVKERARLPPLLPPTWDDASVAKTTSAEIVPYRRYQLPPPMPILGDFEYEMAFPQDVLGSIVYASQAISREAGIKLDAVGFEPDNPDLPGVTVCTKHLTEAVSNILDNAVKYAPLRRGNGRKQGKKVIGRPRIPQIRVTLVSNEPPLSPGATLYIEDNGPGIPTSERDRVFARGYRGKSTQDEVGGSGLGLAIAREMITRMGGLLEIVDEGPNRLNGTTVRVIMFRDPEI